MALTLIIALGAGACDPEEVDPDDAGTPDSDGAFDSDVSSDGDVQEVDGDVQEVDGDVHEEDASSEMDADPQSDATASEAGIELDGTIPGFDADVLTDGSASEAAVMDASEGGPAPLLPCWLPASGDVLLDLGNSDGFTPAHVRVAGERMLMQELGGRWQLWDAAGWTIVAQGERCPTRQGPSCPQQALDMAGSLFVFQAENTLELHSTSDGQVIGTIPRSGRFGLAQDGSYVWTATSTALETWSTTGAPITSRSGDYDVPGIWAGTNQIKIGAGPAGTNVIEFVSPQTGASTTAGPFIGEFHKWFEDGGRFFTQTKDGAPQGQTFVRIYSDNVSELKRVALEVASFRLDLEPFGGYGDYFWYADPAHWAYNSDFLRTYDEPLYLYQVSGSDLPLGTPRSGRILLPRPGDEPGTDPRDHPWQSIPPSNGLLFLESDTLDLRGTSPSPNELDRPALEGTKLYIVAATAQGALFGFTPTISLAPQISVSYVKQANSSEWEQRGCGRVRAVAPSASGNWAIVLEGQTAIIDVPNRRLLQVVGVASDRVGLSPDGNTLLLLFHAALYEYDVTTGRLLRTLGFGDGSPEIIDFALASNAPRLAQQRSRTKGVRLEYTVTNIEGTMTYAAYFTTNETPELTGAAAGEPFVLSPSGRYLAAGHHFNTPWRLGVYADGANLLDLAYARPLVWLNDSRLLVQTSNVVTRPEYQIVDLQGTAVAPPTLPYIEPLGSVDALDDGVLVGTYVEDRSCYQILDVATGDVIWSAPTNHHGRANDAYVLYWHPAGNEVRILAR